MVKTASDQVGVSGSGGARVDFDVSAVKEAKSLSTIGVVLGAVIPGALFVLVVIVGLMAPAKPAAELAADTAADAMVAEEPMAEEVEEAAPAAFVPASEPLGEYTITFTGKDPIYANFSENGTYTDGAAGGTWTYDSEGVWCFTVTGADTKVCFRKVSGSDEISTWVNIEYSSLTFTLERTYAGAM